MNKYKSALIVSIAGNVIMCIGMLVHSYFCALGVKPATTVSDQRFRPTDNLVLVDELTLEYGKSVVLVKDNESGKKFILLNPRQNDGKIILISDGE